MSLCYFPFGGVIKTLDKYDERDIVKTIRSNDGFNGALFKRIIRQDFPLDDEDEPYFQILEDGRIALVFDERIIYLFSKTFDFLFRFKSNQLICDLASRKNGDIICLTSDTIFLINPKGKRKRGFASNLYGFKCFHTFDGMIATLNPLKQITIYRPDMQIKKIITIPGLDEEVLIDKIKRLDQESYLLTDENGKSFIYNKDFEKVGDYHEEEEPLVGKSVQFVFDKPICSMIVEDKLLMLMDNALYIYA